MTPALRMQIALQYCDLEWASIAFHALIMLPFTSITQSDAHTMGIFPLHLLTTTQHRIQERLLTLAFYAPPVIFGWNDECTQPMICKAVWQEAWWDIVAKRLLPPNSSHSKPLCEALEEAIACIGAEMCKECLQSTVMNIEDPENNPYGAAESIVANAITVLHDEINKAG
jgi:hypothetical protein